MNMDIHFSDKKMEARRILRFLIIFQLHILCCHHNGSKLSLKFKATNLWIHLARIESQAYKYDFLLRWLCSSSVHTRAQSTEQPTRRQHQTERNTKEDINMSFTARTVVRRLAHRNIDW